MRFLGWLRNHDRAQGDHPSRAEFESLQKRMEELEDVQLKRELAWKEIRDQISRYLSRAAAYESKQREREEGREEGPTEQLRAALRAKYPKLGG